MATAAASATTRDAANKNSRSIRFAGCLVAQGVFWVAGFPAGRQPFWTAVFGSYRLAALITLIVGVIGTVTESYRERLESTTRELRER